MAKYYRAGTLDPCVFKMEETWYSVGMAVLGEHLNAAAKFILEGTRQLHHTHQHPEPFSIRNRYRQWSESYAFVTGTGIEFIVESYGLEVDPTLFKENFFEWIDTYKRHCMHSAKSNSAA